MEPNVTHIMTLGATVVNLRECSNQRKRMVESATHAKRHQTFGPSSIRP